MPGIFKTDANKARGARGKWSYWYINELGQRKFGTGYGDKGETLKLAIKREKDCKRVRDGLADPADGLRLAMTRTPVVDYLAEWERYILAGGATAKHARQRAEAVRKILLPDEATRGVVILGAVEWGTVAARAVAGDDSIRTRNYRLSSVRSFVAWLVKGGRLAANPLGAVRPIKSNGTKSVRRRVLTRKEESKLFDYLFHVARTDELGASPPERADLYRLALATGLRADELRSLQCGDVDTTRRVVRVRAETAKGSRAAELPLPCWLIMTRAFWSRAEVFRATVPILTVPEKTAKLLQRDLKAAGVKIRTADGVVDFHALRHTFVSRLVAAGVDIKTVQTLARHADIATTLKYYAHPDPDRLRNAVERLADPGDNGGLST